MITLSGLTKRYGETTAVRDLTLEVAPGRVTGFLGLKGADKSTTMRMILGLDAPTEGEALIDGRPCAALRHPLREAASLQYSLDERGGRAADRTRDPHHRRRGGTAGSAG